MEKILVSACLLGKPVRYDGKGLTASNDMLRQWQKDGRVVCVCPEVDAGMTIPRAPAEIIHGEGTDVLLGDTAVIEENGTDVSAYFKKGAYIALALCQKQNIKVAILTENSPSCGSNKIYDGSFSNQKTAGAGVTAALLKQYGILVFNQHELEQANQALQRLSSTHSAT